MRIDRFIIVFVFIIVSCKATKVTTTSNEEPYKEDLSIYRLDILTEEENNIEESIDNSITPQNTEIIGHIKSELDSVNILIANRNKELGYVEGYTIQVYTGTDRAKADDALEKALMLEADLYPEITYRQPSYKVKVGHYTDRLEAHAIFQSLIKHFPNALMIPERISK